MEILLAVSSMVLLGLVVELRFTHYLYKRRFFIFLALAWGANLLYLAVEVTNASLELKALASTPTVYFLLAAVFDARQTAGAWRLSLYGTLTIVVALTHLAAQGLAAAPADWLILSTHVTVTAFVGIAMVITLRRMTDAQFLSLLRRPSDAIEELHEQPEEPQNVAKPLRVGRALVVIAFLGYSLLQPFYVIAALEVDKQPSGLLMVLFWIGLLCKVILAAGLMIWLLADFRYSQELIRRRSMAEELGALAASIEHDIRNPLGIIDNLLDTLNSYSISDQRIRTELKRLEREVERLRAAADVVPTLRESAEYYKHRLQRHNAADLARTAVKSVTIAHENAKAVKMFVKDGHRPVFFMCYRERVITALVNIINNAVEAAFEKHGIEGGRIELSVGVSAGSYGYIAVRDNGGGVSNELRSSIARPLFSTKIGRNERSNRGIGLFVTSRIAEHHRGHLEIQSDEESFTVVTLVLPLA